MRFPKVSVRQLRLATPVASIVSGWNFHPSVAFRVHSNGA